jgi:para-aminobenzoate synthetase component 1
VLNWVKRFDTFSFLDNHQYQLHPHSVECLVAAGKKREISLAAGNALEQLQAFIDEKKCWLFGHLGYDLKNEIETVSSGNPGSIDFPDLYFFEPEIMVRLSEKEIRIEAVNPGEVYEEIMRSGAEAGKENAMSVDIRVQNRLTRESYIAVINKLKEHILRGDCYEINFCQEFFATDTTIDPIGVYGALSKISPNPFSVCYRVNDQYLLCASPERFLHKQGDRILSQPIKGTSRRIVDDPVLDEQSRDGLRNSAKDRSENVMVVDLVRNDLAKICTEGSVKVDELFGIYSFPQVHQMISTISGELQPDISFSQIIRSVFPMGSMTGAPKKRVMELIEEYETIRRGIFSGAAGYIAPNGDFDFNVVIRSILYNHRDAYISFPAGSGITFNSDPQQEWEECLLKAEAMKKVLKK